MANKISSVDKLFNDLRLHTTLTDVGLCSAIASAAFMTGTLSAIVGISGSVLFVVAMIFRVRSESRISHWLKNKTY